MTVEYIRYRIAEDHQAAFLADHERAAQVLERAPQCVDYELSRSWRWPTPSAARRWSGPLRCRWGWGVASPWSG
ncbi:MAG: Truncated hemoglobins-like protein [Blastococcus sp.]|nr:Truncated hemoglobins-like protein [Blastococcus sp.]